VSFTDHTIIQFTDKELEQCLEQLTFAIALNTTHFNAFADHERDNIRKDLQVNKDALRKLRQERDRRIRAGSYNPI
jgi:hypothetical protein